MRRQPIARRGHGSVGQGWRETGGLAALRPPPDARVLARSLSGAVARKRDTYQGAGLAGARAGDDKNRADVCQRRFLLRRIQTHWQATRTASLGMRVGLRGESSAILGVGDFLGIVNGSTKRASTWAPA